MTSIKYDAAAIATLLTTELNGLANGSGIVASASYDNATGLYLYGYFELTVQFGVAPTADNLVNLYLVPVPDGTNAVTHVSGGSPYAPLPAYVGGFPVRAVTTPQKLPLGGPGMPALIPLPPCKFFAYVINNSGQAFPASGSTLKMIPYRLQIA